MDVRIIKGLTVLLAMALYLGAGHLPEDFATTAREAAALLVGWQAFRRPGDLALPGKV